MLLDNYSDVSKVSIDNGILKENQIKKKYVNYINIS